MRLRTAIIWNAISQFGQSGVSLLSTIILARLLTPDDFGIIGIVTIFISFSQMMVDSEMGGALLRKKEVTKVDYSTLFYYNLGVSVVLYIILYNISPIISNFYGKPQLMDIIRIISITILIHAFRVAQKIMIFRELKFRRYAIINIISGLISLVIAILIAKKGYGYWALVWQQVVLAGSNVIMMSISNKFIPVLAFSKASFKYQFSFGIRLLGADTIQTIANNISTNIIAKIANLQFTGYYTQSSRITNFCQTTVSAVMNQSIFPMLARIDEKNKLKDIYYRILLFLTIGLVGMTIIFILFGSQIVEIVLGKNWLQATWIFQILCISIVPMSIQHLCKNILKATGDTALILKVEGGKSVIVISFLLFGAIINTVVLVWSIVIAQMVACGLWLYETHRILTKGSYD